MIQAFSSKKNKLFTSKRLSLNIKKILIKHMSGEKHYVKFEL